MSSTPTRWPAGYFLGSLAFAASSFLPWWKEPETISLWSTWSWLLPFATLAMLIIGVLQLRKRSPITPMAPLVAAGVGGVSLVAYYLTEVDTLSFADFPFTYHVDYGYFVALAAVAFAVVCAVALVLGTGSKGWIAPLICLLVVSSLSALMWTWAKDNGARSRGPGVQIPDAKVGRPPNP